MMTNLLLKLQTPLEICYNTTRDFYVTAEWIDSYADKD